MVLVIMKSWRRLHGFGRTAFISLLPAWMLWIVFTLPLCAQPSEAELAALDPLSQRYHVETVLKRIQAVPFKAEKGFSFVAWGDFRSNAPVLDRLWTEIQKEPVQFAITTGDLVPRGVVKEWLEYFGPIVGKHDTIPFLPVVGNHDLGRDKKRAEYQRIFGPLEYYFDYGNARFVFLDNTDGLSTQQLVWLETLLQETDKPYKFVFAHKPPDTIKKWEYHSFSENADAFCDLMSHTHVTTVYLGHIHAYSTAVHNGIEYVVSGGGGAGLHSRYGPLGNVFHYCVVHVKPDGVSHEVVRLMDGKISRTAGGNEFYQTPDELLPANVLAAVKKMFPNGLIDDVGQEEENQQVIYEIDLVDQPSGQSSRDVEITMQADGKLIQVEKEVFQNELSAAITKFLREQYSLAKFDEASHQKGKEEIYTVTIIQQNGEELDLIFNEQGEFVRED